MKHMVEKTTISLLLWTHSLDYSLIALEASMPMKKTSSGDSPLRQGAGKSFWTLPIFGSTAAADRDVFWKSDRVFRFFPSRGSLYAKGQHQEWAKAPSHIGGVARGQAMPPYCVGSSWPHSISSSVL
jgi:hypothetical protein